MKKANETAKKNQIEWHIIILMSILIGFTSFICMYGISSLNVCNVEWLKGGTDLTQHYLGWVFYRNSDWMFPIGMHNQIAWPEEMSVVYTDSIPLFAVFFKILSPLLPSAFQYFGIFILLSFILQAFFGILLTRRCTESKLFWLGAGLLFVFAPVMLTRVFVHTALSAHFLILMAYTLWAYKKELGLKKELLFWGILGFLSTSIHMYFIPMIGLILAARILEDLCRKKWNVIILMVDLVVSVFLTAFLLGIFGGGGGSSAAWGLGYYNANLNSLYNSMGKSHILKALPTLPGQEEGSAYLGIGVLLLFVITILILVRSFIRKQKKVDAKRVVASSVLVVVTYLLAMSYRIAWNDYTLVELKIPAKIYNLLSIFRSSGRFLWIIVYGILIFAIYLIARNVKKKNLATLILICCTVLQIADIASYYHKSIPVMVENHVICSDEWEKIAPYYEHLVLVDGIDYQQNTVNRSRMFEFAWYAATHDMTINVMNRARPDLEAYYAQSAMTLEQLENGTGDKDTVYVFSGDYIWNKNYPELNLYEIDGIVIGTYQEEELTVCLPKENIIDFLPEEDGSYELTLSNGLYKVFVEGDDLESVDLSISNGIERLEVARSNTEVQWLFSVDSDNEKIRLCITDSDENFEIDEGRLYKEQ